MSGSASVEIETVAVCLLVLQMYELKAAKWRGTLQLNELAPAQAIVVGVLFLRRALLRPIVHDRFCHIVAYT